jgi:hypothetical protein
VTAPAPEPPAGLLETVELSRRLRETEAELASVRTRLRRLESSTAVQFAQVLVAGAREPRRAIVTVPRETAALARRWRARRSGRAPLPLDTATPAGSAPAGRRPGGASGAGSPGAAAAAAPPGGELAARLLGASATLVTLRDRPVLAAIAGSDQASAWAADAHVQRLRPDDAVAVFAAVTPDLLVVDAGAGDPGPWAGLGTYAVPERDRTVLELLRAARDREVPTVLVDPPAGSAPMLADARSLFTGVAGQGTPVAGLLAAAGVSA